MRKVTLTRKKGKAMEKKESRKWDYPGEVEKRGWVHFTEEGHLIYPKNKDLGIREIINACPECCAIANANTKGFCSATCRTCSKSVKFEDLSVCNQYKRGAPLEALL